jgi:hypothetical protein
MKNPTAGASSDPEFREATTVYIICKRDEHLKGTAAGARRPACFNFAPDDPQPQTSKCFSLGKNLV